MAQIQNCTITRPVNNKLANTLKIAVKEIDTLITSATKDLPIAKLYQLVKVGATIAYGLNNLKSGKLKTLLQTVIIKLLKIFNIYFFILKTKLIAATKYSSTSEEKKKNILEKIYKLDMTDVDNALDEFYELNNDNPPKSFFSKVTVDPIILKFEAITEKLSSVINDALTRLLLLLVTANKHQIELKFEDTEQFEAMNSPIISADCNNMDFGTIFKELGEKANTLQSELKTGSRIIEELSKEKQLTKKYLNEKSLHEELGCKPNQIVVPTGPGFMGCADKSATVVKTPDVSIFDPESIDQLLKTSGNVSSTLVATKTKYLKYKEKYLKIKKCIIE
jgi:hypothetical protein